MPLEGDLAFSVLGDGGLGPFIDEAAVEVLVVGAAGEDVEESLVGTVAVGVEVLVVVAAK